MFALVLGLLEVLSMSLISQHTTYVAWPLLGFAFWCAVVFTILVSTDKVAPHGLVLLFITASILTLLVLLGRYEATFPWACAFFLPFVSLWMGLKLFYAMTETHV